MPFTMLLALATVATAGVALWLSYVTAFVLPTQDAAHLPMWRAIAGSLLAYCALSGGALASGARHALLRWALMIVSIGAIALALFACINMLQQAGAGGDFEGYILLMGVILAGHGLAGVLYALRSAATRPPRVG